MTRHHFIPVRKSDIVSALAADIDERERDRFREYCRLLGLTLHYEFYAELERLHDAYFHFDPRVTAAKAGGHETYADLLATLRRVLERANFIEVTQDEVDRAWHERGLVAVDVRAPLDEYSDVRFFRRGRHREVFEAVDWFGLRRRTRDADVYDDVVLVAATSADPPKAARGGKRRKHRDGAVFIKYFHGIAGADLNTLLPEVRVVMNVRDRWLLGLPALVGTVPLVLKLAPTLAVLFLLAGIQLGYSAAVEEDQLKQALAVTSGVLALGGFCAHQWLKYRHRALRYHAAIRDSLYFRNANNNAGVFDSLVGAAEEQEFKEAVLAYRFLMALPSDEPSLDRRIEQWLNDRFGVDVDFEVEDGLAKLDRYGLLCRSGDVLSVVRLEEALRRLDRRWDEVFSYHQAAAE